MGKRLIGMRKEKIRTHGAAGKAAAHVGQKNRKSLHSVVFLFRGNDDLHELSLDGL